MYNSPFTVSGMSSSTSAPSMNAWGGSSTSNSLTAPFGDSLSQSRSHYQSGYLMSTSQNTNAQQGNTRVDEVPIVQTKAKMNHILGRGSASEFGMDSMFQSTRQRQTLADEDAPPTTSVKDIPNEIHVDSSPVRFQPRNSTLDKSQFSRRHTRAPSGPQASQPLYIIVFGYPYDKYNVTVEYFKSLGDATEPEQNTEVMNCFRIGYRDPADAMRAVRKSGEVMGGSWMIGAKWADSVQAEALLGQPLVRTGSSPFPSESTPSSNAMAVDEPSYTNTPTPTVGTPIKLAPASSAFRKTGTASKPATPQPQKGWGTVPAASGIPNAAQSTSSPNKGVLGQVSDLLFGW